jgi:histidine triad (HIT) family protein
MSSIFTSIVQGEVPSYKIAETRDFLAFLDVKPVQKGHVLVIPKKEVDYLYDLDDETYIGLMLFSKAVAVALRKAMGTVKVGSAVIGLEVPHAHIHLIPINELSDMDFSKPRLEFTEAEFNDIAQKIASYL